MQKGWIMFVGINIEKEEDQGIVIIRIEGRMDAVSTPVLERNLSQEIEKGKRRFVLDFAKIDYLSSAGMRLLLSMTKKLKEKKEGLHLCSLNEEVMEIIRLAGFERIIQIFPTEQEAIKGFLNK